LVLGTAENVNVTTGDLREKRLKLIHPV
jgi:hypothetical protein